MAWTKYIDLLDSGDRAFFLQVEGASIDWQGHVANACGKIGETVDLDEAVLAPALFYDFGTMARQSTVCSRRPGFPT